MPVLIAVSVLVRKGFRKSCTSILDDKLHQTSDYALFHSNIINQSHPEMILNDTQCSLFSYMSPSHVLHLKITKF